MGEGDVMIEAGEKTKKCPFCANTIKNEAQKCEFCKEWLDGRPPAVNSNARWTAQFLLMSLCSFGLYFYWCAYKNWGQLRDHKKLPISPGKRTIGMIIPALGYYFTWLQLHDINEAARQAETKVYASEGALMTGLIATAAVAITMFGVAASEPKMYLISLLFLCLEVYVMYLAQATLNDFWQKEQKGLPVKKSWSFWQVLVVLLGGFYLFGMAAAGLIGLFS